jgi:NAD-dependent deacetylase
MSSDVERARALVDEANSVVVLTGAGISTDSGIPDFRGPNGVWTKNPGAERTATLEHYLSDPETRKRSWQNRLTSPMWDAAPNAGHLALVELQRRGKLHTVVTQNIDGLHQRAGLDPDVVIEVHGNANRVRCWSCGEEAPMERALARVRAGEEDPPCRTCGGILKSTTISFGENLVVTDLMRAEAAAHAADLFLAVGSTLGVYPAAALLPTAKSYGAQVIIINGGPTEMDMLADVLIYGSISEVLPQIVGS